MRWIGWFHAAHWYRSSSRTARGPRREEALHDGPLYREFAGLGDGASRLPDETTILRFRHLLEAHDLAIDMLRVVNDILQAKGLMLRTGTAVDATLIAAPSSTKNAPGRT
jgi:IS5 family transposase